MPATNARHATTTGFPPFPIDHSSPARTQQHPTGRDTAPCGREGSRSRDPAYVIRCAAGMPTAPAYYPAGKFLGYVGGWFIPCGLDEIVKRFNTRKVAVDVAARAAQAFPGARFEVEEIKEARP